MSDRKTSTVDNEDTENKAMQAWAKRVDNGTAPRAKADATPVRDPSSQAPDPVLYDQLKVVYG